MRGQNRTSVALSSIKAARETIGREARCGKGRPRCGTGVPPVSEEIHGRTTVISVPVRHRSTATKSIVLLSGLCICIAACSPTTTTKVEGPSAAIVQAAGKKSLARAERRAYDGAPPVIPHGPLGSSCTACHSATGIQFGEMGFAPPMPHEASPGTGVGKFARCNQCHVYKASDDLFVENTFTGLRQDLRHGRRQNPLAPPVMPHHVFMRENCAACHTGPAGREEIRTPHPERQRCNQCHVPRVTETEF